MKRGFIVGLIFFIIVSSNVYAENETNTGLVEGFNWLNDEMQQTNWGTNVEQLSWSILALRNAGYDVSAGVDKLKDLRQVDHWDDGDVKKSALATLTLHKFGENLDLEIEWLKNKQEKNLRSGSWFIQFLTSGMNEVECHLYYDGQDKVFFINDSEIVEESSCDVGGNWVNFESCVQETAGVYEEMSIDCDSNVDASLLYNRGTEYYIVDQIEPLEIENGCFYKRNTCNCEATQYASWALNEIGDNYYTKPYLRSECNDDVDDNAFLFMLTGSRVYSDFLDEGMSNNDGSWEGDEELTALSIIALREGSSVSLTTSKNWLKSRQREDDGSWDGNVKTTAMVLYALTSEVSVIPSNQTPSNTTCYNGVVDAGEECEFDYTCGEGKICEGCVCTNLPDCEIDSECDTGDICVSGVCVLDTGCDIDDDCGLGYYCTSAGRCERESTGDECNFDVDCDDGEECNGGECVNIEEEGGNIVTVLVVIFIVLLGLAGGYFGYKQYFSKKRKKPSLPGSSKPSKSFSFGKKPTNYPVTQQKVPVSNVPKIPVNAGRGDRIERELDKSLRKAKDLLRKK
jgi:hypothetical protein